MMSLSRMPSSIASRVRSGRQSMARRRSSIGEWRSDIGCAAVPAGRVLPQAYAAANAAPRRFPPSERTVAMQLGVHVGYWGLGLTSSDQLEIVQEAERLGYDSVWTAEAYGSDAAAILGWLPGPTARPKIGSAVFQMPARPPAPAAVTGAPPPPPRR